MILVNYEGGAEMAAIAKIARHYQVVIPREIRTRSNLKEGDLISFEERDGEIIMIPVNVVKKDQAYFWSPKWQNEIRESEAEIKKGKYKVYRGRAELRKDFEK